MYLIGFIIADQAWGRGLGGGRGGSAVARHPDSSVRSIVVEYGCYAPSQAQPRAGIADPQILRENQTV